MKAWLADFGGGLGSLRCVDLPTPSPQPWEVLVRVDFVSLNRRDDNILEGRYPLPVKPTLVPACDAAGTILAVGPDVEELAVGDRVVLAVFPHWKSGRFSLDVAAQLGGSLDGVLREELCYPADAVVRIPDGLSSAQACCLPCAAVTAWHALELLRLSPAQTVHVTTT